MEESIRTFEELGDDHYARIASYNLAWVVGDLGDKARQRELLAHVLKQARLSGERRLEAGALAVGPEHVGSADRGLVAEG
jgi:hypothetical protein